MIKHAQIINRILILFFICMVILIGCNKERSDATLTLLEVRPGNLTISHGANQQFKALGTFSDGTTRDLANEVQWTSQDPTKATITGTGVAMGISDGVVEIRARAETISDSTTLTVIAAKIPGYNWTDRSNGNFDLDDIAWTGTQFVAVGFNGEVVTSPDGRTWTVRNSGTTETLSSIAWSGAQLVAVGGSIILNEFAGTGASRDAIILTSLDGVTWTMRDPGTSNFLNAVVWADTQFVAVGWNGTILTSPDGVTWTLRSTGISEILHSISWSGKRFVSLGVNGTILTSEDGVTWMPHPSGIANIYDITWSGTQFVAAGYLALFTSPDGVAWTAQSTPGTSNMNIWYSIASSGTQLVVVGNGGLIFNSLDGETWSPQISGTGFAFRGITWSGTQFVAVGDLGLIMTSP